MSDRSNPANLFGALLESDLVPILRRVCGGEACLVGGVLRDTLLGREAVDLDVVVAGGGRRIAQRLAETLEARLVDLGGERFASYRLVARNRVVDLWDRRGQSLEDDLRRRDLTINSIALELGSGNVVDPFDGCRDIRRRCLRATTEESFVEDPQRVLRLVRFAVSLGFDIEPNTQELALGAAPGVSAVAIERIRSEVEALIGHSARIEAIELLSRLSLYPHLWMRASPPRPAIGAAEGRDAAQSLARLADWCEEIRAATSDLETELDSYLTAMTLLYLAANPTGAGGGSEPLPAAIALTESRLLTRRQRSAVARLVTPYNVPDSSGDTRWFLHQWGDRWLDAVAVWGARAESASEPDRRPTLLHRLAVLAREHGKEIFDPPALVSGDEVGRLLAIGPGPQVGRCLDALRRRQIEGEITSRSEALAFVADWEVEGKS